MTTRALYSNRVSENNVFSLDHRHGPPSAELDDVEMSDPTENGEVIWIYPTEEDLHPTKLRGSGCDWSDRHPNKSSSSSEAEYSRVGNQDETTHARLERRRRKAKIDARKRRRGVRNTAHLEKELRKQYAAFRFEWDVDAMGGEHNPFHPDELLFSEYPTLPDNFSDEALNSSDEDSDSEKEREKMRRRREKAGPSKQRKENPKRVQRIREDNPIPLAPELREAALQEFADPSSLPLRRPATSSSWTAPTAVSTSSVLAFDKRTGTLFTLPTHVSTGTSAAQVPPPILQHPSKSSFATPILVDNDDRIEVEEEDDLYFPSGHPYGPVPPQAVATPKATPKASYNAHAPKHETLSLTPKFTPPPQPAARPLFVPAPIPPDEDDSLSDYGSSSSEGDPSALARQTLETKLAAEAKAKAEAEKKAREAERITLWKEEEQKKNEEMLKSRDYSMRWNATRQPRMLLDLNIPAQLCAKTIPSHLDVNTTYSFLVPPLSTLRRPFKTLHMTIYTGDNAPGALLSHFLRSLVHPLGSHPPLKSLSTHSNLSTNGPKDISMNSYVVPYLPSDISLALSLPPIKIDLPPFLPVLYSDTWLGQWMSIKKYGGGHTKRMWANGDVGPGAGGFGAEEERDASKEERLKGSWAYLRLRGEGGGIDEDDARKEEEDLKQLVRNLRRQGEFLMARVPKDYAFQPHTIFHKDDVYRALLLTTSAATPHIASAKSSYATFYAPDHACNLLNIDLPPCLKKEDHHTKGTHDPLPLPGAALDEEMYAEKRDALVLCLVLVDKHAAKTACVHGLDEEDLDCFPETVK